MTNTQVYAGSHQGERPLRAEEPEVGLVRFDDVGGPSGIPPTTTPTIVDSTPLLLPLAGLLARHAARQHLRRHRGYGLIEIAAALALAAAVLAGIFLFGHHQGGGQ